MSRSLTVWLLQTGEPLHIDEGNPRPMRAMNLANALIDAGHRVVVWSSSFYHQEKRHRVLGNQRVVVSPNLEIRLVQSPGYRRNIGPGRLWDHAVLARNLARELNSQTDIPDVAFVGYPPIETAAVMTRWLKLRHVPCVLDVKDQWPTIFVDALPTLLRPIGRIALAPYYYLGRRCMRDATALSSMANGFLQWATRFAGRSVGYLDRVVPLTAPLCQTSVDDLDAAGHWWDQQGVKADGTQRVIFVGSHSKAFEIEPVFLAARAANQAGARCQFVMCGDGAHSHEWRERMAGLNNVVFPGWIDRAKIEALARRATAALAPYHNSEDFVMSVPNKVVDSLGLGLPLLSSLRGEVMKLIEEGRVGMSYGSEFGQSLSECLIRLANQPGYRDELAANASRIFQSDFSFESVYGGLVKHLELLAQGQSDQT